MYSHAGFHNPSSNAPLSCSTNQSVTTDWRVYLYRAFEHLYDSEVGEREVQIQRTHILSSIVAYKCRVVHDPDCRVLGVRARILELCGKCTNHPYHSIPFLSWNRKYREGRQSSCISGIGRHTATFWSSYWYKLSFITSALYWCERLSPLYTPLQPPFRIPVQFQIAYNHPRASCFRMIGSSSPGRLRMWEVDEKWITVIEVAYPCRSSLKSIWDTNSLVQVLRKNSTSQSVCWIVRPFDDLCGAIATSIQCVDAMIRSNTTNLLQS